MSSLSSQEHLETENTADDIELLPVNQNGDSEPAKKSDVVSYHSDGSQTSRGIGDDIDAGIRGAGTKGKRQPRTELIKAIKAAKQEAVIDKWIEYLKVHPKYEGGEKIIDECKCEYEDDTCMNAVHVAVIRNKVQILKKLADADADLEKCTEDKSKNPPLVLAARQLPKTLFEEEISEEPTLEKGDDADKQISKLPVAKIKSKRDPKADDAPRKGAFRERASRVAKDIKHKKERIEKITAEKDEKGRLETTFHVLLQRKVNVNSQNDAGLTALHVACDRGIIVMVRELLMVEGIDINKEDKQQNTPLHTACISGEKDVVFALIKAGADAMKENKDKMIPLHLAVVERKLEIVKMVLDMHAGDKEDLLQAVEKDCNSPFLLAVKTGDKEMVQFFLDNGANVADQNGNDATALHLATSLNKVKIMQLIYSTDDGEDLLEKSDRYGCTPLHYAAKYNQIEALEFLVDRDADMEDADNSGKTPLLTAAANGKTEAVIKLLESGADVVAVDGNGRNVVHFIVNESHVNMLKEVMDRDAGRNLCNVQGKNGNTPLHSSCEKGNLEIVKIFLDNDVGIDERNDCGQTPLHLACIGGHHETVAELLKKSARTGIKDKDGKTPLHFATSNGHLEIVKCLINNQADIDVINDKIGTPLTCAAKHGHEDIVEYLLKSGADVDGKFLDDQDIKITPLIAASQNNHVRIVKRLLKQNADVTFEYNDSHYNCLGEAVTNGHSDVALAIVQSDQWEDAMRMYNKDKNVTPMKLLIKAMPEVATVVLNRCITDNKCKDTPEDHGNYYITYNYEFLEDYVEEDSPSDDVSTDSYGSSINKHDADDEKQEAGKSDKNKQKRKKEKKEAFKWGPRGFKKQDHPLQVMVESQRIELLNHPLVTKLLDHKWKSFGRTFYLVNMGTYLIFLVFLTAFALLSPTPNSNDCLPMLGMQCSLFNDTCAEDLFLNEILSSNDTRTININGTDHDICSVNTTTSTNKVCSFGVEIPVKVSDEKDVCTDTRGYEQFILRGAAIIVIVLSVIRICIETIQILRRRRRYFLDWENWMELCLFVATVIFVSSGFQSGCLCPESWQWQLGALALFIAWLEMVLFLKKIPCTGIYVVMFVDVFYTFMGMILLFILFVVSFGLAFYMLFFRPGNRSAFSSPGRSLVKTMVMTTGEFDFDGIFFNSQEDAENDDDLFYPEIAYTLWIVFIILMPIILTNLLVGLAVDDIKGVQETAALKRLALHVDLALDVEDLMIARIRKYYRKEEEKAYPNHKSKWYKFEFCGCLFPKDDSKGKKKSIIGDLQLPLSPIEHIQAETAQHSEELFRLKLLNKELIKKQENMDQKIKELIKKQDLILHYLTPKIPISHDAASTEDYVSSNDVTKTPAIAASGDKKSTTSVEGEHRVKSSGSKKSSSSSSKKDDDDYSLI